MKIVAKSLLMVVGTAVLSVAGTYTASLLTLLSGYLRIEEADTRSNVHRAVNVFHDQSKGILLSARAYAVWDDMYRVIQEPDGAFIRSLNLNPQLFKTHQANFIAILDRNYRPLFQELIDLDTLEPQPVPLELTALLQKGSYFLDHLGRGPEILGVVTLDGRPMVLASLAGMHTDFTGPPLGAVLFGRYVDEHTASSVSQAAEMEVSFHLPGDPGAPEDVKRAEKLLLSAPQESRSAALALDTGKIAGYAPVLQVDGRTAFLVRILLPRHIYAQGLESFFTFALYSGVSGLLFLVVLLVLLKKVVLSRLTDLGRQVREIQGQSDDSRRVSLPGKDELSLLAQDINGMLTALEKERKDLQEANQELEAFTYSLTHHIKAPILSVGGFAGLLKRDHGALLDGMALHYLDRIADSSAVMAKLVGDLIDYSLCASAPLQREEVDLSAAALKILEDLKLESPQRKVSFAVQPGLTVRADEKLVKIALSHLLQNAFKFTLRQKDALIEVGSLQEGDRPVFFVRDNGAGFDMKYADQLFMPFHQLHSPKEFSGTGLGLALVQKVLQRHGGRVWAEGGLGRGAVFFFAWEEA